MAEQVPSMPPGQDAADGDVRRINEPDRPLDGQHDDPDVMCGAEVGGGDHDDPERGQRQQIERRLSSRLICRQPATRVIRVRVITGIWRRAPDNVSHGHQRCTIALVPP